MVAYELNEYVICHDLITFEFLFIFVSPIWTQMPDSLRPLHPLCYVILCCAVTVLSQY